MRLYPYQSEAVRFAFDKKYSLNAFEMGLGKTHVALGLVRRLKKKTLVVCPAFLVNNWKDEIKKNGVSDEYFTICSYTKISHFLDEPFHTVIIDEAHYLKNPDSQRSKIMMSYVQKNRPKYLLMLTGTPLKNDASEIFSLLKILSIGYDLKQFKKFKDNYWRFKNYFMNRTQMIISGRTVNKFKGIKNKDEFTSMVAPIFLRRRTDQTIKLPESISKYIRQNVTIFDDDFAEAYNSGDKQSFMTVKAKAAEHTTLYTLQILEEIPGQCVIFTDHVISAKKLAKALKVEPIYGNVKGEDRDRIVEDFKTGKTNYLVATYKTAGVGLTLTNACHMVFNDLPYVPADLEQAKARIRRIGQKHTCYYYYMALSSMYFRIFQAIKRKTEVTKIL